jgi:YebC/PmpR family DNA-binding regulatory protein
MGRIFEVRKHAMFARWNRMAKQFTRVAKDIAIAVHNGGPDPAANPTLRRILQNARAVNMPKDKTDAAIRRASGKEAANYQEILYEGYAPHGVALLVETATDNPTRTVANVRNHFTKGGGNFGSTGSVSFLFKKMGVFRLDPATVKDQDELELDMIDHGLEEMARAPARRAKRSWSCVVHLPISAGCRRRSRRAASRRCRRNMNTSARCRWNYPRPRPPRCWH